MGQRLPAALQDREEAEFAAEMPAIDNEGLERLASGLEKHHVELARRARIGNPLGNLRSVQRHPTKKAQRANRLVECRLGDALRHHTWKAHFLQPQPIQGAAEITAEHCHGMQNHVQARLILRLGPIPNIIITHHCNTPSEEQSEEYQHGIDESSWELRHF